ncbi:ANTAR domain-containing protein [Kribbella sp. NPDC051620]|uniref:ANTAR domain-containing protein n=1 Tax=Kribbella sp. NPDC051620 TaxID=3364120 RepID=UPI00378A2351
MDPAVVQQAVGVLMDWYDISPDAAARQLQAWADKCGATIGEVAEGLVRGICLGRPTSCPEQILRRLEDLLRQLPTPAMVPD